MFRRQEGSSNQYAPEVGILLCEATADAYVADQSHAFSRFKRNSVLRFPCVNENLHHAAAHHSLFARFFGR